MGLEQCFYLGKGKLEEGVDLLGIVLSTVEEGCQKGGNAIEGAADKFCQP